MRYITIPENAYRACDAMTYNGESLMWALIEHAFDGEDAKDSADELSNYDRPVFIALHEAIDDSLIDDSETVEPCEHEGTVIAEIFPLIHELCERDSKDDDDHNAEDSD